MFRVSLRLFESEMAEAPRQGSQQHPGPAGASGVAADVSRRHIPGEQSAPTDVGGYYTLSRERHVEVDGKVADAVLGRFQKDKEQFVAVLEGKGARDPLDHPFAGRRMSAVDEAYRYAISNLVNQAYALIPAEIELMWQTAPPRMPVPPARDLILRVWHVAPLRCPVCRTPPARYRRH